MILREKTSAETLVRDKLVAEAALSGLLIEKVHQSIIRVHVPSERTQRAWLLAIDFPDFLLQRAKCDTPALAEIPLIFSGRFYQKKRAAWN